MGNLYTVKAEQADGKATGIQFEKNDQAQAKEDATGTYVLRTNRLDLSGEEISKLHRSLTTKEESFETMKGATWVHGQTFITRIPQPLPTCI